MWLEFNRIEEKEHMQILQLLFLRQTESMHI